MRILVLSPRQCFPSVSGAKLREFHFLRSMGEWGELSVAGFLDPESVPIAASDLPFCKSCHYLPKPPAYGPMKVLRGVFGRWPLPVLNYTSEAMTQAVLALSHEQSFDIIHVESIHMLRYVEALSAVGNRTPVIYNWHNIESELMQRYAENATSPARRIYASLTSKKLAALERSVLRDGFGHVVCSDRERELLGKIAPNARIVTVSNGVDCDAFADGYLEETQIEPEKRRILFVGSMDYFPNAEGAIWFAREIWPKIRERIPKLEFVVVGARPTEAVLALREVPGVVVTGTVPDVRPFYREALAAVVPLRTGGGTRLKILEAMAAGTPVVSTPLGAEGLDVTPEEDFLRAAATEPETWVRHLERLAANPERRMQLAEAGRRLVRRKYDWSALGTQLVTTYADWLRDAR